VGVRPLLEAVDVEGSAARIPALDAAARALAADSVPDVLRRRASEVRDLVHTLRASLGRAAELAPAAAGTARAEAAAAAEAARADSTAAARGDPADALATPAAGDGAVPAPAAPGDVASTAGPADSVAVDPLTAYLDTWGEAQRAAEALLHLARDPAGEPDPGPAPVSPAAPG
jgi:hypothetical protein